VSPLIALWVAVAGSSGAVARFVIDGAVKGRSDRAFPLGTFVINVSGSLAFGLLTGFVIFHHVSSLWSTILGTGFCGGFTTFSTASFETVRLIQTRMYRSALLNGAGALLLCLAAAGAGMAIAGTG
jgi:CrcB protein